MAWEVLPSKAWDDEVGLLPLAVPFGRSRNIYRDLIRVIRDPHLYIALLWNESLGSYSLTSVCVNCLVLWSRQISDGQAYYGAFKCVSVGDLASITLASHRSLSSGRRGHHLLCILQQIAFGWSLGDDERTSAFGCFVWALSSYSIIRDLIKMISQLSLRLNK
jgi:hypothetical protein